MRRLLPASAAPLRVIERPAELLDGFIKFADQDKGNFKLISVPILSRFELVHSTSPRPARGIVTFAGSGCHTHCDRRDGAGSLAATGSVWSQPQRESIISIHPPRRSRRLEDSQGRPRPISSRPQDRGGRSRPSCRVKPVFRLALLSNVISIVAVHGLNGHRDKTWTASNGVHWHRDLLPNDIPNARIFCWGYDANTHGDRVSCQYLFVFEEETYKREI